MDLERLLHWRRDPPDLGQGCGGAVLSLKNFPNNYKEDKL